MLFFKTPYKFEYQAEKNRKYCNTEPGRHPAEKVGVKSSDS